MTEHQEDVIALLMFILTIICSLTLMTVLSLTM